MEEKEQLEKLVKESESFAEILRKQGKAVSGAAIKILKNKLDEYEIRYDFIKFKEIVKYDLKDVLVENRPYNSSSLRKRLLKEGYKKNVCEICGQTDEWNGKHLVLQLDHINGNHHDSRLENLRIVCPNCHTQTDTFGTKVSKSKNKCIDCGTTISSKSKRCRKCVATYNKSQNTSRPVTKEQLFDLIKTKSFTEIGKMYNVSDNAVRKWCQRYDLPRTKKELKQIAI